MRLTAVLAIACLFTLAFAGCSGKDKDDGDGTSTSTSSSRSTSGSSSSSASRTATSSSSTSTGPAPSNQAPTGSVSVLLNGSAASFNLTGSDPDGDTIVWDLDFGDGNSTNGTSLPTMVNHTYVPGNSTGNATGNATGNPTAVFTITDGRAQVSYNVTLNLTGGGPKTLFTFTQASGAPGNPLMSAVVPTPLGGFGAGASACAAFTSGESGGDCVFTALDASLAGKAFTGSASAGEPDLEFWDVCDPVMGAFVANFYEDGPEAGTVPEGAGCVILWDGGVPPTAPGFPTFVFTVNG